MLLFSFYLSIEMAFIARFTNCLKIVKTSLAEQCLCRIIYGDQIQDDEWKRFFHPRMPSSIILVIMFRPFVYSSVADIFQILWKVCNSNFIIGLTFILTFVNYFLYRSWYRKKWIIFCSFALELIVFESINRRFWLWDLWGFACVTIQNLSTFC